MELYFWIYLLTVTLNSNLKTDAWLLKGNYFRHDMGINSHRISPGKLARTIASTCTSGVLSTIGNDAHSMYPLSSNVKFILDENGYPTFCLHEYSLQGKRIIMNPNVTLFCDSKLDDELPKKICFLGTVSKSVDDRLGESGLSGETVFKLRPSHIYIESDENAQRDESSQGDNNELSPWSWVNVSEFQSEQVDSLYSALPEVRRFVSRLNSDRSQEDLRTLFQWADARASGGLGQEGSTLPLSSVVYSVVGLDGGGLRLQACGSDAGGATTGGGTVL